MAINTGEYMIPKSDADRADAPIMMQVFAQTHVGQARDHNEDAFVVANLTGGEPLVFDRLIEQQPDGMGTLLMVADGMGGAAAGEIASATAIDVVLRQLREELRGKTSVTPDELVAALNRAAELANWTIFQYAAGKPDFRGMGTTATIVTLLGDRLYLAQVGDSRAYLVRDGATIQITKDQSLMQKLVDAGELTQEEAEHSERRNIILQALGPEASVKIDLTYQQVRRGDVVVLCSDGLSGLVRADEIGRAVMEELDLPSACDRLIGLANDRGGPDNITVVMARFEGDGLEPPRDDDQVRHQVFTLGSAESERETPVAPIDAVPPPRPAAPSAPAPDVDAERKRRGLFYVRLIAVAGVLALLYVAWRFLKGT